MMGLTLRIVCRTLFDVDVPRRAEAIGRDILTAQSHAMRQIRVPFPLPKGKALAALARLDETIYGMIRDRRGDGCADRGDLLSMLLLARDEETGLELDDKAVRDEAMTLFLAGHETTALATSYSCYLLAKHPEHFARLRAEGLPFALQVLKESMRLFPPAYGLRGRHCGIPSSADSRFAKTNLFSYRSGCCIAIRGSSPTPCASIPTGFCPNVRRGFRATLTCLSAVGVGSALAITLRWPKGRLF